MCRGRGPGKRLRVLGGGLQRLDVWHAGFAPMGYGCAIPLCALTACRCTICDADGQLCEFLLKNELHLQVRRKLAWWK